MCHSQFFLENYKTRDVNFGGATLTCLAADLAIGTLTISQSADNMEVYENMLKLFVRTTFMSLIRVHADTDCSIHA